MESSGHWTGRGIYIGSSVGAFTDLTTYDQGIVPPNTTCKFYGIKGPANPVSAANSPASPTNLWLSPNYPNPFNPSTVIRFELPMTSEILLVIYNSRGQQVRTFMNGQIVAGSHQVVWDGRDAFGKRVASGVYFFKNECEE